MRALIIDDERLARNGLRRLLASHPDVEIAAEAANAEEALRAIQMLDPDLIFLDVEMPGRDGFELLQELEDVPFTIFTTAYDQYAVRAFEASALDYLVKPISLERLEASLSRARRALNLESTPLRQVPPSLMSAGGLRRIFVRDGDRCWIVRLADIVLMESEGNYTRLYFGADRPLLYRSLAAIEERVDPAMFFRANRFQIINLRWIEDVGHELDGRLTVQLARDKKVEISRRQSRRLRQLLSL